MQICQYNRIQLHITNVTHCGRVPVSEQILCVALQFIFCQLTFCTTLVMRNILVKPVSAEPLETQSLYRLRHHHHQPEQSNNGKLFTFYVLFFDSYKYCSKSEHKCIHAAYLLFLTLKPSVLHDVYRIKWYLLLCLSLSLLNYLFLFQLLPCTLPLIRLQLNVNSLIVLTCNITVIRQNSK